MTLGASANGMTEVKSGVKAGNLVIVHGQEGLPDEAGITVKMNPARVARGNSRAVLLLTLLAPGAGAIASVVAAEQHLSAAAVPARRRHRARRHDAGAHR